MDRAEHEERLRTDPKYAEHFSMISIPEGRKFTVMFECIDRFESTLFLDHMYGSRDGILLGGCKIWRLDLHDEHDRREILREHIRKMQEELQRLLDLDLRCELERP